MQNYEPTFAKFICFRAIFQKLNHSKIKPSGHTGPVCDIGHVVPRFESPQMIENNSQKFNLKGTALTSGDDQLMIYEKKGFEHFTFEFAWVSNKPLSAFEHSHVHFRSKRRKNK